MPRKPSSQTSEPDLVQYTFLKYLADKCRLSTRTMRSVLSGRSVTWTTALRISRATGCPMGAFKIKEDRRGLKGGSEDISGTSGKLGQNEITEQLTKQTASKNAKHKTRARVPLDQSDADE